MRLGMTAASRDAMATQRSDESWTIPLHIIMFTTLFVGVIMVLVVFLMHC